MSKTYIIAELSGNHGGSLDIVLQTVDAAKEVGADAIKLQTFTPDSMTLDINGKEFEANPNGPWAGQKLYDLYKTSALPYDWHDAIFKRAKTIEIDCFSSPFDIKAVDFLEQYNPPAYKIASFEITHIPLIKYTASKGKPIIISTGVADYDDIKLAIETCKSVGNNDITILKCTSSYPTLPEDANLSMIKDIAEEFGVKSGLSDHTMGIEAPVMSVAFGAKVIEKHFILDKAIDSVDAHFSLDKKEFNEMVKSVRIAEKMYGKVDYNLDEKKKISKERARSIYISKDVKKGDTISNENIKIIRPAYGLHPKHFEDVLGKKFSKDLEQGNALKMDYIESLGL